jgi:hypothetical protein
MTENDRCEFVRKHLPLVVKAAAARLEETNPGADAVIIDAGHLPKTDGRTGDRRKTDRRKGERRKVNLPKDQLPHGERRRSDRRKTDRRRPKGS